MKKLLIIMTSLLFFLIGTVIFLFLQRTSFLKEKETLHIAVAGPMSGDYKNLGDNMKEGISLYIDKINKEGGIKGKKIVLDIFDDQNNEHTALKAANQIVSEKRALTVLGHYFSSTSIAAGDIYKRNEIPAITASATAEKVTGNDWYFRVVPNNHFQAEFIAAYIRKVMMKRSASIIFDNDEFGTSLARGFEGAARKLGIEIKMKRAISRTKDDLNFQIINIITDLSVTEDPGVIFFATHGSEAVECIIYMKNSGMNLPVIGSDSFSNTAFLDKLKTYPMEQTVPGFYSDNIYAPSPFFPDIAGKKARIFREEFIKKYNKEPNWVDACYYDAAHVAVEAVKKADIKGKERNIRSDRQKIKEALSDIYSIENSVKGVSGDIFFDAKGDAGRPYMMGIYKNSLFLSSYFQYQQLSDIRQIPNIYEKALTGDIIFIKNIFMNKSRAVHTNFHINEITDPDMKNSRYAVDFFLWFRFQASFKISDSSLADLMADLAELKDKRVPEDMISKLERMKNQEYMDEDEFTGALQATIGESETNEFKSLILKHAYSHEDFHDTDIEFVNIIAPVKLKDYLIKEEKKDGMVIRLYRIKAVFKSEFDFHHYPFDRQEIAVKFRHARQIRDRLIYVPDRIGLPYTITSDIPELRRKKEDTVHNQIISGWIIKKISVYEDIINNVSTLGNPRFFSYQHSISYSQINLSVQIQRKGILFLLNNFFLIIFMAAVLYLGYFIPSNRIGLRVLTLSVILLTNTSFHLKFLFEFPVEYMIGIEYTLFTVYGLLILFAFISVKTYMCDKVELIPGLSVFSEDHTEEELIRYRLGVKRAKWKVKYLTLAGKIIHPMALTVLILYYYMN